MSPTDTVCFTVYRFFQVFGRAKTVMQKHNLLLFEDLKIYLDYTDDNSSKKVLQTYAWRNKSVKVHLDLVF